MKKPTVNKAIQVALVEDDPGVRANLAAMLDSSPGFRCQAAYSDGLAALKSIPANRPDVVLMDINLPGMLGPECVRRLKSTAPSLPVLMLTVYDDSEQVLK
jgi:DNA-binding NarL/FixJ family response regulator